MLTVPPSPKASLMAWHSGALSCAANHAASLMVKGSPSVEHTELHGRPQPPTT